MERELVYYILVVLVEEDKKRSSLEKYSFFKNLYPVTEAFFAKLKVKKY